MGIHGCPRQLLTLFKSFPKVVQTDTYGCWWSNSRCTQTNTESFSISHLLLCKKHLNYLVHLGLEQALGRFWHSSRNQSGEKAKRKILLKKPSKPKLQLSASVQEHYEHFPSVLLPFQLPQQQWHWQVRVSRGAGDTVAHSVTTSRWPQLSPGALWCSCQHHFSSTSVSSAGSVCTLQVEFGAPYMERHLPEQQPGCCGVPAIVNTDKDQKLEQ